MIEQQSGDEAVLILAEGAPNTGTLDLQVTPRYAEELAALLAAEHLAFSNVDEFSFGSDLIVYAIGVSGSFGGLAGVAKVLTAFFHKYDGKKWTLKVGDTEYSVEGCSLEDAKRWVTTALGRQAELDQRKAELRARETKGRENPSPNGG